MSGFTLDRLRELPVDAPVRDVAAALDFDVPGWERRINLETLNMNSPTRCVAGQIARTWRGKGDGYAKLVNRIGAGDHHAAFAARQQLRPHWLKQIRKRLGL